MNPEIQLSPIWSRHQMNSDHIFQVKKGSQLTNKVNFDVKSFSPLRSVKKRLHNIFTYEQNQPIVELEQFIELKVGEVLRKIQHLINQYEDWKTRLVTDPEIKGGEPVFPDSRLSVYRIGSLLNRSGANELPSVKEEIVEDYPYLSQEDLIFARMFVSLNPREGRPKKS